MAPRSPLSTSQITLIFIITITISSSSSMAEIESSVPVSLSPPAEKAAVYIVYTDRPPQEELEVYHLRTLSSVLGSDEAAKEALLYTYKHAASGFAAKLTPKQVEEISKQPGVVQVSESRTMHLLESPAKMTNI